MTKFVLKLSYFTTSLVLLSIVDVDLQGFYLSKGLAQLLLQLYD